MSYLPHNWTLDYQDFIPLETGGLTHTKKCQEDEYYEFESHTNISNDDNIIFYHELHLRDKSYKRFKI
jgi:hypothetical protein